MAGVILSLLLPLNLLCFQQFPLSIAHRGASAHAPENTIPAILEAMRLGADAVEIDVRMTSDSQLVVIHDAEVERTSDGEGNVQYLTLTKLRSFDAGSWFSPVFRSAVIPTLREALSAIDTSTLMIVEIKSSEPNIERRTIDEIDLSGKRKQVILKSFDPSAIRKFEQLAPDIPRIYVFAFHIPLFNFTFGTAPRFERIFSTPAEYLQIHRYAVSESFIAAAHRNNFRVIVWGVDTEDAMMQMIALGADGIETDFPDILHRMRQQQ